MAPYLAPLMARPSLYGAGTPPCNGGSLLRPGQAGGFWFVANN
jgi:hypothetical protein